MGCKEAAAGLGKTLSCAFPEEPSLLGKPCCGLFPRSPHCCLAPAAFVWCWPGEPLCQGEQTWDLNKDFLWFSRPEEISRKGWAILGNKQWIRGRTKQDISIRGKKGRLDETSHACVASALCCLLTSLPLSGSGVGKARWQHAKTDHRPPCASLYTAMCQSPHVPESSNCS